MGSKGHVEAKARLGRSGSGWFLVGSATGCAGFQAVCKARGGWPTLLPLHLSFTKLRVPHPLGYARGRLFTESALLVHALGVKGGSRE